MLLDTSGLFCCHDTADPHHATACTYFEAAGPKLIHSYVVAEFVALVLARRLALRPALNFLDSVLVHREVEVVWVSEGLTLEAIRLLRARADKGYSLCDAVSFVLMRREGFSDALTTDRHFEQEGFRRLLK
jgi:predicted nucleic acid-binding protein